MSTARVLSGVRGQHLLAVCALNTKKGLDLGWPLAVPRAQLTQIFPTLDTMCTLGNGEGAVLAASAALVKAS